MWALKFFFPQICSICYRTSANSYQSANHKAAKFLWLICKLQNRKFLWCASPLITNRQIFHNINREDKTFLLKSLTPFSPLMAKTLKNFGRRFVLFKLFLLSTFELEHFKPIFNPELFKPIFCRLFCFLGRFKCTYMYEKRRKLWSLPDCITIYVGSPLLVQNLRK